MTAPASPSASSTLRTPLIIMGAGAIIAMLTFGPRASFGLFTPAFSVERGWSVEVFSLAAAIQNLLWGLGQPFAGAIADRFGAVRVLWGGALLYAAGLAWMSFAADPLSVHMSAGGLIGFGLSGCSFNLVLAAFGKLLPEDKRTLGFGVGSAAGSFGQFLFAPLSVGLIGSVGWQTTLIIFAGMMLLVLPAALLLATPKQEAAPVDVPSSEQKQSFRQALAEAFGHRSYNLLVAGFFVCGFHIAFITIHLPKYLTENGVPPSIGGWVLALIGLFNIVGALGSGYAAHRFPKRWVLSFIYGARAVVIAVFIWLPLSPATALAFGAAMGLLWLSTVPATSGLILVMFGPRYLATLYGVVFFSHQVGSFLGLIIGGWARETTGSYDLVWYLGIALGIFAALVHLPIKEQAVERPGARPAALPAE